MFTLAILSLIPAAVLASTTFIICATAAGMCYLAWQIYVISTSTTMTSQQRLAAWGELAGSVLAGIIIGAAAKSLGNSNCFTAETPVLVPDEATHVAIAAATEDANGGAARRGLLAGACLVVGVGGWYLDGKRLRNRKRFGDPRFLGAEDDPDDPFSDEIDDICKGESEMSYHSEADACFENWGDDDIICWSSDEARFLDPDEPVPPWAAASGDGLAVAEREPIAMVAERRQRPGPEVPPREEARRTCRTLPLAAQRAPDTKPNGHRFGRWWLAGCLMLAVAFGAGRMFGRPARAGRASRQSPPAAGEQEDRNDQRRPARGDAGRRRLGRAHRHRR